MLSDGLPTAAPRFESKRDELQKKINALMAREM